MKYRFTCIVCPLGCSVEVELESGRIVGIRGNACPRGEEWAREELLSPKRTVITVLPVSNSIFPVVSVKTLQKVPKSMIPRLMNYLASIKLDAPVRAGDVVAKFEDVDIVATRDAPKLDEKY